MEIIKRGHLPTKYYRIICDYCKTEYEITDKEANHTEHLAIMHDGLPERNYYCPVCHNCNYFDSSKTDGCTVFAR